MAQKVYLSNLELNEAVELYFNKIKPLKIEIEKILTREASGRVTAAPVYSLMSSPFYNSSAMDGIAVQSSKTIGASDRNHIELTEGLDYIVVDTGDPIPREYDCVIMVEDLIPAGDKKVKIYKSAVPWQNIRPIGEDIVQNQLILPSNQVIRPVDIGAMIAGGVNNIQVYKRPKVGIIPTGTEIVEPGSELKVGDIVEFNSRIFSAQVCEWGGIPERYNIVKDDYSKIMATVEKAAEENDVVLINAGSSAGREDFTSEVISELGQVYVHGISIKPGKPVILGQVKGKPVIGIPGYPVSAYFIMEFIVKRLIKAFQCINVIDYEMVDAVVSRRVMSSLKYLEFVRVNLGYVGDKIIASPLSRGAGATMSLVRADGVLQIPQSIEGIEGGTTVQVQLLKKREDIKNTLVCIGSHDPILDVASDMIHLKTKKYFLASSHVGSMGGIMALKKEETHIAPIHLLDENTGEYNISYINKYLRDKDIVLVKCVKRVQGLMVQKGNPLGITNFQDIRDKSLSFVNRQRGSGTRILFDYNIKKLGIKPGEISGYEREEFTHLAVAAAVQAGDADCGLGVYSAAEMMNLDFIPLCSEEYDFAIPQAFIETDMIKKFIEIIKCEEFLSQVEKLGGYEYKDVGKIIYCRK